MKRDKVREDTSSLTTWSPLQSWSARGHNKNLSECKTREGNSLLNKPSLKVSNNLFHRALKVKRDKVREDTPSLTTWSPLQSWSVRGHNKNWSQCKMREGNSLLNKPSLKVSNNLFYRPLTVKRDKVREDTSSLTTWSPLQSWSARGHNKNLSECKTREGNSLLNKPSLKVSNNLFHRALKVKRDKVREDTPSLTTWSPLQSWSVRGHNKNWSQCKMREGNSLLKKPSLKVSNNLFYRPLTVKRD